MLTLGSVDSFERFQLDIFDQEARIMIIIALAVGHCHVNLSYCFFRVGFINVDSFRVVACLMWLDCHQRFELQIIQTLPF